MAAMVGPITPTVGQPYKLQLPVEMDRIAIDNDSPYDCWVYFGNVQPTDLTNANNTWHRVARRNHTSVLPVEGFRGASARERSPNAFAAFGGTVWLLLVNPGGIAYTGTVSARSQLYVTPLLPGDPSPVHAALATATDLSSQPRVVAVPFGLAQFVTGLWDPTGSPTSVAGRIVVPAALAQAGFVFIYLYYASAYPNGTGDVAFNINAQPQDSGNNNVGGAIALYTGKVAGNVSNGTGFGCEFAPTWPMTVALPIANTVASVAIQLVYLTGIKTQTVFNIAANIDSSNSTTPGEIGNAALWRGPGGGAPIF